MINEVIVVGVFKEEKDFLKVHGKKYLPIIIEVEKAFMNSDGGYDRDKIECLLWKGEADRLMSLKEHCHWISVKGRLETIEEKMYVFAEKIKYLDSQFSV